MKNIVFFLYGALGGLLQCEEVVDDSLYIGYTKGLTHAGKLVGTRMVEFSNTNPADALIDLLICDQKEEPYQNNL